MCCVLSVMTLFITSVTLSPFLSPPLQSELGYRATSSIVVAAAVTVLYDFVSPPCAPRAHRTHAVMPPLQDRLPEKSGVHTTASVFRGTSLISRLAHRGITFKVVSPLAEL